MNSISFKDPLIHQIEAGRKTQTRRLVHAEWQDHPDYGSHFFAADPKAEMVKRAPWSVGSRLWVKQRLIRSDYGTVLYGSSGWPVLCDTGAVPWPWKPRALAAMYCPRWASRLTVEVTGVRVERLQDISEDDCWAEGIEAYDGDFDDVDICRRAKEIGACIDDARPLFSLLWDSIHGKDAPWSLNPWIWVVSFRLVKEGEDV